MARTDESTGKHVLRRKKINGLIYYSLHLNPPLPPPLHYRGACPAMTTPPDCTIDLAPPKKKENKLNPTNSKVGEVQ